MRPRVLPARYGNFQMLPRPIAEPAAARMNPIFDPQCSLPVECSWLVFSLSVIFVMCVRVQVVFP